MKLAEIELNEGIHDPHRYKAVFVVGGPSSGKTTVTKKITGGTGLREISADHFIELFQKKFGENPDPEYLGKVGKLTRQRRDLSVFGGLGLLLESTGRKYESISRAKNYLESLGYDTMMVYVNADIRTAKERNKQRPRQADEDFIEKSHKDMRDNLGNFQMLFGKDNFVILDNSEGSNFEEQLNNVWKQVIKFIS